MKKNNALFLRILFLSIIIGICFYFFKIGLIYTFLFSVFFLIVLVLEFFYFIKNIFSFYDKTMQAILQNDFSADFSKHKSFHDYTNLFKLYEKLKTKENEQFSKDMIYQSILNNIETGILILQKDENDWNIFLMNDYFSKHFTVPKVSK